MPDPRPYDKGKLISPEEARRQIWRLQQQARATAAAKPTAAPPAESPARPIDTVLAVREALVRLIAERDEAIRQRDDLLRLFMGADPEGCKSCGGAGFVCNHSGFGHPCRVSDCNCYRRPCDACKGVSNDTREPG